MVYVIVGFTIMLGVLGYKLYQKQKIDKSELEQYNEEILRAKLAKEMWDKDINEAKEKVKYEKYKLEECKKDLQAALDTYQELTEVRLKEIDEQMDEQRQKRQADLDAQITAKNELVEKEIKEAQEWCNSEVARIVTEAKSQIEQYQQEETKIRQQYESLLEPIKQYEKERQEKLFYTIQLPEEYQEDIEFLLTTVATKVQHPDIISKLVWSEYVKPNLDETFKRIDIHAEPGIYKLTSLETGKCYVGKSTNVKTRIADHFKSVVGIKSIADQAVHHAILKEGFWNWMIEIITYCDKEKLSELEKYYINFFKSQEFGYNKNAGG